MQLRHLNTFLAGMFTVLIPGYLLLAVLSGSRAGILAAVVVVALLPGVLVWLAPIYIARSRNVVDRRPIALITVLLGWTFFGWIAALAWSITSKPAPAAASS